MDEINNIFSALMGGATGILPSSAPALQSGGTASSVLGTVAHSASATSSSSGGIGNTIETVALDVLKSGFGLVPIIGSLFGLFGGGGSDPLPALVKYQMPATIDYQAAESNGQIVNVDYGQSGAPRAFGGGSSSSAAAASVTVNVQAMDARSFLDRSSDIAAAVKDAMLNLNSINDVVNDL